MPNTQNKAHEKGSFNAHEDLESDFRNTRGAVPPFNQKSNYPTQLLKLPEGTNHDFRDKSRFTSILYMYQKC
jgi:hypothetical protein